MSRYLKYIPPFAERNRAGEKICVMCGKPLEGRKEKWCGSQQCFQLQWLRSGDQNVMRRWLEEREHEICQVCGMDCGMLRRVVLWVINHDRKTELWGTAYSGMIMDELLKLGIAIKLTNNNNFVTWEADHIIPVAEGGKHHEDNIRTLCVTCHRRVTKKLKQRIAEKQRLAREGYIREMYPMQDTSNLRRTK